MTTNKHVREGDDVLHKPTGETWCVASVYTNGDILCAGWPCTLARVGEFELLHACTDEEHETMLKQCATMHPDSGYDPRKSLAMDKLRLRTALAASQETPTVSPDAEAEANELARDVVSALNINQACDEPLKRADVIASGILPLISARDTANAKVRELERIDALARSTYQTLEGAYKNLLAERDELRERLGRLEKIADVALAYHDATFTVGERIANVCRNGGGLQEFLDAGSLGELMGARSLAIKAGFALASLPPKGDANENE